MRAFWMGTCVKLWLSTQLNLLATAVLIVITFFSVHLKHAQNVLGMHTNVRQNNENSDEMIIRARHDNNTKL